MPARRWTEHEARAGNIADVRGFNREYNQLRGLVNAGLDRTVLPSGWLTRTRIVANALHYTALSEIDLEDDGGTLTGNADWTPSGVSYATYAGGFVASTEVAHTGLHAGMAHVGMSCILWHNVAKSNVNPKGVRFRLLWNGLDVAEMGYFHHNFGNAYLCADFPIAGDGTLTVAWAAPGPLVGTDLSAPAQVYFGGGQILFINRHR